MSDSETPIEDRKVTITVNADGYSLESDFDEQGVIFWFEFVKQDMLTKLKGV